ncbi:MAG: 2-C-methyl-D-erythritol 4-phosphate cytidylyltransferase [Lachnospiraceae bacterium]|nr:2-C-methyl-D-erythritol 4-phosphate cytidylyltransferase [Lachnospiraceae bacterium]
MNIALLLSGGTGSRMGADIPKQYIMAGDRPICAYCMETLFVHPDIDAVQIVADPAWQETIVRCGERLPDPGLWKAKFGGFSLPGENRQLSIFHGLEDIRGYGDEGSYVLVHDAARPLLSAEQISSCLQGIVGHDGAMPVLPMKDTVYYSRDGRRVGKLLDRSTIFAGQAPEVFVLGRYYEANRRLLPDDILKINGSTEPAILAGLDIAMIPGDEGNFKVTTKADLERFCKMTAERERKK